MRYFNGIVKVLKQYLDRKRSPMNVDLFIKKMPHLIKDLISREAADNRRSINQEAIALLEEALLRRVDASSNQRRRSAQAILQGYAGPETDTGAGALTELPQPAEVASNASPLFETSAAPQKDAH